MMRIPFRTLFAEHRHFDVAEMFGASDCIPLPTVSDQIINKTIECLNEISSETKNVISVELNNVDYISELGELLRTRYERRFKNFTVLTAATDSIDLSVRASGVKGVLRWAFEKYFIFRLISLKDLFQKVSKICLRQLRESPYYLPNLVFGYQGFRSSIDFWIKDGKVRYAISPPPKVSKIFLEYGIPIKYHEAILRYYLAVAVTMLNPLNCYMGEPAVPIVRQGSCGESVRVVMYSRDFDYECGKSYGEELINRLACKLAEELTRR